MKPLRNNIACYFEHCIYMPFSNFHSAPSGAASVAGVCAPPSLTLTFRKRLMEDASGLPEGHLAVRQRYYLKTVSCTPVKAFDIFSLASPLGSRATCLHWVWDNLRESQNGNVKAKQPNPCTLCLFEIRFFQKLAASLIRITSPKSLGRTCAAVMIKRLSRCSTL